MENKFHSDLIFLLKFLLSPLKVMLCEALRVEWYWWPKMFYQDNETVHNLGIESWTFWWHKKGKEIPEGVCLKKCHSYGIYLGTIIEQKYKKPKV